MNKNYKVEIIKGEVCFSVENQHFKLKTQGIELPEDMEHLEYMAKMLEIALGRVKN